MIVHNSTYHPNVQWAFVNPSNVDLTNVSGILDVLGNILGKYNFQLF